MSESFCPTSLSGDDVDDDGNDDGDDYNVLNDKFLGYTIIINNLHTRTHLLLL